MSTRKLQERMCIGCHEQKPKRELMRIVRTPTGELLIDDKGKVSGRGAYLCHQASCLQQAVKGKRLNRALKVAVGDEILAELMSRLQ